MDRDAISENNKRKLYAESMGRCMNPDCKKKLFGEKGDIIEKAHIVPYCKTADNSYENLVILCPNCHTEYDKNELFTSETIKGWKQIRKAELDKFFGKTFTTFEALSKEVVPLLMENKTIYEKYYLGGNKTLWDKFEYKVLENNKKLKMLFSNNLNLFQNYKDKDYSNLECVYEFMQHVDEFENTRSDDEKVRQILFPQEINSIFGIAPVRGHILPSTEALERLITKLHDCGKLEKVVVGEDNPHIRYIENSDLKTVYLDDTPKVRQLYYDYKCFTSTGVRFSGLNFALKYMKSRGIHYEFVRYNNLREIILGGVKILFVYEYCLSEVELKQMLPEKGCAIVNLHNWNGGSCISKQAYELADEMGITLLTMEKFYGFVNTVGNNK